MRPFPQRTYLLAGALAGAALLGAVFGRTPAAVALPAAAPAPTATASSAGSGCDGSRSVEVSGTATVNVVPDRVLIKLGVESNGPTPDAVQSQNLSASQSVIAAVRGLGVAPRDISSDYYIVEPVHDSSGVRIEGYRINNVVAITLSDVSKTSAALVSAFKAGANKVVEVQFYTSELRRHRDEARALAMKAAGEKAQALAGGAGAQVGCALSIKENSWSYYSSPWWARNPAQLTQNVVQQADQGGAQPPEDTPIGLGKIAVRAEVNVSYSLR